MSLERSDNDVFHVGDPVKSKPQLNQQRLRSVFLGVNLFILTKRFLLISGNPLDCWTLTLNMALTYNHVLSSLVPSYLGACINNLSRDKLLGQSLNLLWWN